MLIGDGARLFLHLLLMRQISWQLANHLLWTATLYLFLDVNGCILAGRAADGVTGGCRVEMYFRVRVLDL